MNFEGLKDRTRGLFKSCSQKASGFLTEIQSPQDISSDTDKICWEDMWSDEEYREAMSVKVAESLAVCSTPFRYAKENRS